MHNTVLLILLGWGDVLSNISPYAWGSMGVAFGLTLSIVGAAWCVSSFVWLLE